MFFSSSIRSNGDNGDLVSLIWCGKFGTTKVSESEETFMKGLWSLMLSLTQRAKKLVPWIANLGMLNLAAVSIVQGKNRSVTIQLGRHSWISCSSGSCIIAIALKKLRRKSSDGIRSRRSHSSGKPFSTAWNLIKWMSISIPKGLFLSIESEKTDLLRGPRSGDYRGLNTAGSNELGYVKRRNHVALSHHGKEEETKLSYVKNLEQRSCSAKKKKGERDLSCTAKRRVKSHKMHPLAH